MKIPELDWNDTQLSKDQVVNARSVTVVLLYRGRNAWHSTWVQHYIRKADLFSSIEDAKLAAEQLRAPGNVFYIKEAPALVLDGIRQSLILVDPNSDTGFERFSGFHKKTVVTSLGNFVEGVFFGCLMKDAHNALIDFQKNWKLGNSGEKLILGGVLKAGFASKGLDDEFAGFISVSHGGKYMLGWKPMSNNYSSKCLNNLISEWNSSTSQLDKDSALKEGVEFSKTKWIRGCQKGLEDLRLQRDQAREAHIESVSTLQSIRSNLLSTRIELVKAKKDRLNIGESSSELRAKRERVESAQTLFQDLEATLLATQGHHDARFGDFLAAKEKSDSLRREFSIHS